MFDEPLQRNTHVHAKRERRAGGIAVQTPRKISSDAVQAPAHGEEKWRLKCNVLWSAEKNTQMLKEKEQREATNNEIQCKLQDSEKENEALQEMLHKALQKNADKKQL